VLADRARALEDLTDLDQIWAEVLEILAVEGFDFAIYLSVEQDFSAPRLLTNIPDIYAGFRPESDPFLSHCCQSYAITKTGTDYLSDHDYLPEDAKAFIAQAGQTGFLTGLGIPMRLQGSSRFGGFNIGSRLEREAFEANLLPKREELRLFCLLVHRRLEELEQSDPRTVGAFSRYMIAPEVGELAVLTPREREVAYLVAQGYSRKECARACDISQHTVSDYLKSVYGKLGVNDRVRLAQMFYVAES
jgi:DNA-binding CsgD family transcriptional regulator